MQKKPKQRIKVALRQTPSGQYAMAIWIFPVVPKSDAVNSRYMLADFDQILDMDVDCDGVKKKPQLILKMICRLSDFERRGVRRNIALQKAREGSPMLW